MAYRQVLPTLMIKFTFSNSRYYGQRIDDFSDPVKTGSTSIIKISFTLCEGPTLAFILFCPSTTMKFSIIVNYFSCTKLNFDERIK